MAAANHTSYFRDLQIKLAVPVLVGSGILILYYWKLVHLTAETIPETIIFAVVSISLSLLWPIPFNKRLLTPVTRYLKGKATAEEAEAAAAVFPIYSALISIASWALEGIAIVWFSISILRVAESFRLYLFMAAISGGLAASFVHFHIVRNAMVPVRARISQDTASLSSRIRYPILIRLLGSFTLLIGLSLIYLTLLNHAQTGVLLQQFQLRQSNLTASIPWEAGGIILLTMLIGGLVSYFAASDISKPLNEMREATKRIADGDFSQRLHIITDDEVADLGQSINIMAEQLRTKVDLLQNARDVAQEKSKELEEANKELMKLDELKSNFLANISHELKAPLVSTKGYIDFMLSGKLGPLSEKQVKGLSVSRDNLNLLSRLISSLLDFSKLTSGDLKLRTDSFALPSLIESCMETIKVEARRKDKEIQFVAEVPPELPMVFGDPDRIREVVMNLLTNAEKFTAPKGRIKIAVASPAPEDDHITLSVIDNGIGIPQEHLNKIFTRFYQVDGSSTRKYGGTGLGLAIVKEILEAHQCKIHVESSEGLGSKFTFTLPVYRGGAASAIRFIPARPAKRRITKLVEVIEDDPDIAAIVKLLLEEEGFAVIHSDNGKDGLRIAQEHRPDLITLDVYLPDINGFDLLKQLHEDSQTSAIPVIILSILMDKEKGFQLGAADYLEKPIDEGKLRETVNKISRALDGTDGATKIMVVDDDTSTLEFFEDCLSTHGYNVYTVGEGSQAIDCARREHPNLILLDLIMPGIEGLEVLRQLKADQQTRDIPVVVLTGKGRMEDREKSIQLGADDFIAKPFELREIVQQVKKYFQS